MFNTTNTTNKQILQMNEKSNNSMIQLFNYLFIKLFISRIGSIGPDWSD